MPPRLVSPHFVGRVAELGVLSDALGRADGGEPATVVVGGEAGVGKTRLVEELSRRAAAGGALVLAGRAVEMGGDGLPFAPLVEALRALVRTIGADGVDRLLPGRRVELARLLPELAAPAAAGAADQPPGVGRLFDLVLSLLERLSADGPVVLVVEDLHWADRSTRDLLAFLVRGLRTARVLLVVTYRSDELRRGHPLRGLLAEVDRLRRVERIVLDRFDRVEVAAQIRGILSAEPRLDLVERVYERSEGNAFFVEELVCADRAGSCHGLTPSLRDLLLARVEELSERAQRVLRVAASGGAPRGPPAARDRRRHAAGGAVRRAAGGGREERARRRRRRRDVRVPPRAGPGGVARRRAAGRARPAHTAFAEDLERDPALAGGGPAAASEIAYHWYAAHDTARALPAALAAADAAVTGYAYAEALHHLERALRMWERAPDPAGRTGVDHLAVLERAVDAARHAGEPQRALALARAAVEEAARAGDPVRRALLLERQGYLVRVAGLSNGVAEYEEAVRLVPVGPPSVPRTRVLESLAHALALVPQLARARQVGEEALAVARAVGCRAGEASALGHLGGILVCLGQAETGVDMMRWSRTLAEQVGDDEVVLTDHVNESDALDALGRHEEAIEVAQAGRRLAHRVGWARTTGTFLAGNVVEPLLKLGRWEEADRILAEAFELAPAGVHAYFLHRLRGDLAVARGDLDTAASDLRVARHVLDHRDSGAQYTLPVFRLDAELSVWAGRPEGVPEVAVAALDGVRPSEVTRYAAPLLAWAMRAAADTAARARD
ncbi:MAG TPA: AAA family ATPase, partial [Frankiaceae bacterium]|nr:AAA family ATPase [Frankiaceae bacterium]